MLTIPTKAYLPICWIGRRFGLISLTGEGLGDDIEAPAEIGSAGEILRWDKRARHNKSVQVDVVNMNAGEVGHALRAIGRTTRLGSLRHEHALWPQNAEQIGEDYTPTALCCDRAVEELGIVILDISSPYYSSPRSRFWLPVTDLDPRLYTDGFWDGAEAWPSDRTRVLNQEQWSLLASTNRRPRYSPNRPRISS